ncbi:hypothetical protein SEA_FULCRUM_8 [Gordonia phage Fulcrum]|uniref:Uncharacterized protein n=1 Tax=Gordonia phage Fulcrum TaxID=3077818 RepID=A0AA96KM76_9CAUD|nr:hypothetical protein SEA_GOATIFICATION_8 [Gordonia phage GOATification]WNO27123.1 hypothetical protein SEA_FULCRUM_8 [Gordonia phage Fulcrum]
MAKRKRKAVRRTLKGRAAKGRIPRDKNGKFVDANGRNRSTGPNLKNLKKGRTKAAAKKRSKKKSSSRAGAIAAGVAAYAANRYTNKLKNEAEKHLSKAEDKVARVAKAKIKQAVKSRKARR